MKDHRLIPLAAIVCGCDHARMTEPAAMQRVLREIGVGRMNNLGIERHE